MTSSLLANLHMPNNLIDHNTHYDQVEMIFSGINDFDFSDSFPSPNESSVISSNSYVNPIIFSNEFIDPEILIDEIPSMEVLENIPSEEIEEIFEWINENYSSPMEGYDWSPSLSLESTQNSVQYGSDMALVFPGDDMKVDDQLNLLHLLKAYGEAIENGEKDLAEMIIKSVNEKISPIGNTMERVAYNLFQSREDQGQYLRQESSKNSIAALKVLYPSLPCGKFAHFSANSSILKSIPYDVETLHIIDFDICEGIQWPSVIESLRQKHKALRITSIKLEEEFASSSSWNFEQTKERIMNHARQYGLKLQTEEKSVPDLANELMRMKKRGKNREWLVFNCMVGLPHMGRRRPRSSVNEFLRVAKELLASLSGIVILGDGEPEESKSLNAFSGYSSFFNEQIRHYHALFESLENKFPNYLAEARTALESLFLAPFMSPDDWFQDWEEITNSYDIREGIWMEGWKFSQENLAEARHVVNEMENSYNVEIEGLREHEMVLRWKDTPLVRVSTWM